MTVLLIVSMPPPITGQATAARLLADELKRREIPVQIFDTASPVQSGGLGAAARTIRRTLGLARALWRAPHVDPLVYIQLGQGRSSILRDIPLLLVAARRGWRVIGHLHGGGWRQGLDRVPAPFRQWYLSLLGRAEAIVVLTPRLETMFDGLGLADQLVVIGNGVERHIADAAADQPARWSASPTVLFLGNLMPEKGFETVLAAARLASERQLDLHFVLAGGSDAPVVSASWPANAMYAGLVDGVAKEELLAGSQALVLPTSYWVEGEPISILEAMHFGLPVISCDRGGIADVIGPDNGAIIEADDPEALLEAIVTNTADCERWQRVSDANRRQARTKHSLDTHLAAMINLFGLEG